MKSGVEVVSLQMFQEELNHQLRKRDETKGLEREATGVIQHSSCVFSKLKFSYLLTTYSLVWAPLLGRHWRTGVEDNLRVDGRSRITIVHFSFLRQAVFFLQNTSQLTYSHTSTLKSICKTLPGGTVTGGQPNLEHLQELAFGVRVLCLNIVECPSPHIELNPKVIPLCRYIQNLFHHFTKIIQGQLVF